jgi:hypothetical protein
VSVLRDVEREKFVGEGSCKFSSKEPPVGGIRPVASGLRPEPIRSRSIASAWLHSYRVRPRNVGNEFEATRAKKYRAGTNRPMRGLGSATYHFDYCQFWQNA